MKNPQYNSPSSGKIM